MGVFTRLHHSTNSPTDAETEPAPSESQLKPCTTTVRDMLRTEDQHQTSMHTPFPLSSTTQVSWTASKVILSSTTTSTGLNGSRLPQSKSLETSEKSNSSYAEIITIFITAVNSVRRSLKELTWTRFKSFKSGLLLRVLNTM